MIGTKRDKEMEIKMINSDSIYENRKKTRRGKKRRPREANLETDEHSPGKTDVYTTSFDSVLFHPYNHSLNSQMKKSRRVLRPTSPKAPCNSTQFLIEDRENVKIDDVNGISSPGLSPASDYQTEDVHFQMLDCFDDTDYNSITLYDEGRRGQKADHCNCEDDHYTLLDHEDTANFICREFEREYELNEKQMTQLETCNKHTELMLESKNDLIQKIIMLEEMCRQHKASKQQNKIDKLKQANKFLATEIQRLKERLQ